MAITFRAFHSQMPSYISELLQPNIMSRSLVSPYQCLLAVPRSRLKTKGDVIMAPELWNSLSLKHKMVYISENVKDFENFVLGRRYINKRY